MPRGRASVSLSMPRKRKAASPARASHPSTPTVPPSADGEALREESPAATHPDPDAPSASESVGAFLRAWQSIRAKAEALSPDGLVQPNVPVRDAALLGLRVANGIEADPAAQADFAALAATRFFDARLLRDLPVAARAVLYVRARADSEGDASDALPPALAAQARALHGRMLKVLGFYFDEGSEVGAELARIRGARGHAPLAGALVSLAALYGAHQARIEKTPEHYRADDAREAAETAEAIVAHLTAPEGEAGWAGRQARVWTLFAAAYEEVCAAGRYLYRNAGDLDARFPALASLNVARRGPAKKRDAPAPDGDPK